MSHRFSLGTIAGVRVTAHWSVVLIWALLAWTLASRVLPDADPASPEWLNLAVGALTAAALLGALLVHELSHAVTARRHGLETKEITLWVFGGVAQLAGDAPDARTELAVAIAGPLTSLGLAAASAIVALSAEAVGLRAIAVEPFWWLALLNAVLAAFNLMPGFPLDGGRVLRAFLWHRSGDRVAATDTAAGVGRSFGLVLVILGILELASGYVGGLWYVLIGWFVMGAAAAERQSTEMADRLGGLTIDAVMSPDPDVVAATITVQELVDDHLMVHRHSTYPVVDVDGGLCGLATLATARSVPRPQRATTRVGAVMVPLDQVVMANPTEPVAELLTRLSASGARRSVVIDHGRVVGVVTPSDISRLVEVATV